MLYLVALSSSMLSGALGSFLNLWRFGIQYDILGVTLSLLVRVTSRVVEITPVGPMIEISSRIACPWTLGSPPEMLSTSH